MRTHPPARKPTIALQTIRTLPTLAEEELAQIKKERDADRRRRKRSRWLKIGVGSVVGGTIIGITGGLAAPFVAAGAGVWCWVSYRCFSLCMSTRRGDHEDDNYRYYTCVLNTVACFVVGY